MAGDRSAVGFVGRERELSVLVDCVARVATGAWGATLVEGEAGIGKTRLLDESLLRAEGLGVRVRRGRGHELERTRPFGPLVDCLGMPDISTAEGAPAGVQYHVVEAVLGRLEQLTADGPLIVAIDDLQWVDQSTLLTLHAIGRRLHYLPLALLLTARPIPRSRELDRVVESLEAAGGRLLVLEPLKPSEIDDLVREVSGATPGASLRRQVSGSHGNPLFVIELLRALDDAGSLVVRGGLAEADVTTLPPSLHQVLFRRLGGLEPATLEVLRVASVLGPSFEVAHLAAVTGQTTVHLVPPLAEALRSGLLDEAGERLAFRHDLIWEVMYEDMAPAVRAGLHLDTARALVAFGAPPAQIAEHFAAGAPPGDREAVRWLHDTAREIVRRAPGMAATLLQRAVEIAGPMAQDLDLLLGHLAVAQVWSGQVAAAEVAAREVLGRDHDRAADSLLRLALTEALYSQGRFAEALEEGQSAFAQPDLPPPVAAQMLAESVFGHFFTGDAKGAVAAGEAAVIEGERVGDSCVVSTALAALALQASIEGRCDDAIRLGAAGAARAAPSLVTGQQFASHAFYAACLLEADRFEEAEDALRAGRWICEQWGQATTLPFHQGFHTMLRFLIGEWDDALAEAEASLALAEDIEALSNVLGAHAVMATVALFRGDLAGQESALARGMAELAKGPQYKADWLLWAKAVGEETRGDPDAAMATLEQAWGFCAGAGIRCALPGLGPDLTRLLVADDQLGAAAAVAEEVGLAAAGMDVAWARAAALRCRGLAGDDPDLLLEAVAALENGHRPLDYARTCEDAAAVLARAGRVPEAAAMLSRAHDFYESVRADLALARVGAARRSLGVRPGRPGRRPVRPEAGWASLTPTERRVAEEVAVGISNRQVADRLFMSPRTVETHLSHVFAKLGVTSRGQLIVSLSHR